MATSTTTSVYRPAPRWPRRVKRMLPLTLAVTNLDRTRAVLDSSIVPEGIDLNCLALGAEEIFWRMGQHDEFDASEMSGTSYVMERSKPNPRFIAVPVFSAAIKMSGSLDFSCARKPKPD